jgi:AcrR family transcriptional regulator
MARPRSKSDEQVMAATMRAVSKHGVSSLTLAHVAEEAGLAPSTLAERYGSKRALLLAAARSGTSAAHRLEADTPIDYLVALAGPVRDRRAFAHHLAFLELDVADPEFRAAAAGHVTAVLARLESFGLSAREARALYVAYNGALVLWALTGEGSLEDALRADLAT